MFTRDKISKVCWKLGYQVAGVFFFLTLHYDIVFKILSFKLTHSISIKALLSLPLNPQVNEMWYDFFI